MPSEVNKSEYLLEAKALGKQFPCTDSVITVLDGVNFALRPGESVSIRGESGCGKSTLLNILSGLERADTGQLFWEGEDVSKYSLSKLAAVRARFIGFVFQAYYLAPELNALENVLLGARIAGQLDTSMRERAELLLIRVGLKERIRHSSTQLSGGERQRVAVARAMINDPSLVLADEPTGNLDESTGYAVMDLLMEIAEESKKSLLLVTHNPDFAARTQRQLTLYLGKMANQKK